MADVAGVIASSLELISSALESYELLERRRLVRSFRGKSKTAIDNPEFDTIRSEYGYAVTRLQGLLATDIQHLLSNADFARIENLGTSSLVLGTIAFAGIEQAKRKRKPDTSSLLEAIKFAAELTAHIRIECERLENLQNCHSFDGDLQASSVYSRTLLDSSGGASVHTSASMVEIPGPPSAPVVQSETPRECTQTPISLDIAEVETITSSFKVGVPSLSEDRYAHFVKKEVRLVDDNGECQLVNALLDTGANQNYIAETKLSSLKLKNATRKLSSPAAIEAANSETTAYLVVRGKWRLPKTARFYEHLFIVVPNLGYDLIIGRNALFDRTFLIDNPELCSLGLPDELKSLPELYVLGMRKLSKDEEKRQNERTKAKEKANKAQREKEAKEARERLTRASSSNASANAGNPASSSGSSNTTK